SHSISLLHSIFLSFFQYFPSSLSLYLIIHSHSCSLFFQLLRPSIPTLFSTFLSAFFDFTVLYPAFHFLYFLHAMSISSTLSIDHSNISFLQSILYFFFSLSFSLSLSLYFLSHSIPLLHSIFSPSFNIFPLHSLFTVFIQSHSCLLFFPFFFPSSTLLSFFHSSFLSSFP